MSRTANENDSPGGNYPDRGDAARIEPDQEALRDDAGVGGALAPDAREPNVQPDAPVDADAAAEHGTAAAGTEDPAVATQSEPALAQNHASDEDKVRGIVAQTTVDLPGAPAERVADVLTQRFTESGVDVGADRIAALAAEIAG